MPDDPLPSLLPRKQDSSGATSLPRYRARIRRHCSDTPQPGIHPVSTVQLHGTTRTPPIWTLSEPCPVSHWIFHHLAGTPLDACARRRRGLAGRNAARVLLQREDMRQDTCDHYGTTSSTLLWRPTGALEILAVQARVVKKVKVHRIRRHLKKMGVSGSFREMLGIRFLTMSLSSSTCSGDKAPFAGRDSKNILPTLVQV
jgi:hypothetical protein